MFAFENKTVVVVGGTSGINLGIAKCFAKAGANVAVVSRSQDKVDAAVEMLTALGSNAMGVSADVRHLNELENAMASFKDRFGEIDVLVSGAAGNFPARAMDMSANAFASVINIDLLGTFHVMKAAYPHLKKPGASVINISAPQSYIAADFQSHVCSAKAGVDMLTRNLAREWGPEGVRVNSVVPGPIEATEGMNRLAPTKALQDAIVDNVPLGRNGTHEDIGNCCMFLSSQFAGYISGVILPVDGAWSLGGYSVSMNAMQSIMAPKTQ
jgi:NAD(P)-dependent dehydrogenase (short-subunit alcohol dehydrogenase family)